MATTLETLDLKMKTLMEAWNTNRYGRNVQGRVGVARPGMEHLGEPATWTTVAIPQYGIEPIAVEIGDTPENKEIYDNFIHAYNNQATLKGSSETGGMHPMFYWFFKFADIVPSGTGLRSLYVQVFGNDTPNPTAQSAVAVSRNIFRQNDDNQKIELGGYEYRREEQYNENNEYARQDAILASSDDNEDIGTAGGGNEKPETLYRAYFGDGPAAEAQRVKGNNSPNGYRQNDTRTQFTSINEYDETKGRVSNVIDKATSNVLDWIGLEGLAEQFAEQDAINQNLVNRWYGSGAGSKLQGGTALKGGELLHIGFWDTLFPPKSVKDANRKYTSELVSNPMSEINYYKWGNDYLLRFYSAMGAQSTDAEATDAMIASNSFVSPPSETAVVSQSKAGFNAGQIKPYDGKNAIWNVDKTTGANSDSVFKSVLSSILGAAGSVGFNLASSSLGQLQSDLEAKRRDIYQTFAPGYRRVQIPFLIKENLDQLLKQNLLVPEDLAPGRPQAIAAAAEDNSITNSDVFGQLYINNASDINKDESPAGSIAGIPVAELQAPANTGRDAADGTLATRENFVYSFSEDTLRANTFTKQRGFQDNIPGNVLEEFETNADGGIPTLAPNTSSIKGVLPAVENDPDDNEMTQDKTTLLKTLSKGDTQFFPFMFETVNKGGTGLLYNEFKQYAYFQAAIQGISESYSPAWSSKHFFGRTEQVQSYTFTERTFDIQFIIFAPEIRRLQNVYERVSWLAQQTYASYDTNGRMKSGPIIRMTIGDMFSNLTGFIRSLSYDWNYLGPGGKWEITQGLRIPMACSVSMNFTVMHDDMPDRNYNFYPGPLLHPLGLVSQRGANGGRATDPLIPTVEGQETFRSPPADMNDVVNSPPLLELMRSGKTLDQIREIVDQSNRSNMNTRKMPYIAQLDYNKSMGTAGGTTPVGEFADVIF